MCRKACGFDSHHPHQNKTKPDRFIKLEEVTLNIEKQYQEDHSVKLIVEADQDKMGE